MPSIYTQQINHILRIWYLVHFVGSNQPHKYTPTHICTEKIYTKFVLCFFKKKRESQAVWQTPFCFQISLSHSIKCPFFETIDGRISVPLNLNAYLLHTFCCCCTLSCLQCLFFLPSSRHTMNYAHWLCYREKLQTDKFMCKLHFHVVLTCYDMHYAHTQNEKWKKWIKRPFIRVNILV